MPSKKDYKKALAVIEAYTNKVAQDFIGKIYCARCGNEVNDMMHKPMVKRLKDLYSLDSNFMGEGGMSRMDVGYGSRHDGESFIVALCDCCIDVLKEKKLLIDVNKVEVKILTAL